MYMAQEPVTKVGGPDEVTAKSAAQLVYILQAVGFFIGLTWIAAVIVNYVKLDDARGTWVESHFRWQIRTFWFGLLWGVIGAISMFVVVGFAVLAANYVWLIYRMVKGWLYFNDRKPMYQSCGDQRGDEKARGPALAGSRVVKKARHAYRAFARERGDQNLMRKPHERRSTSPLPPMPSATR
jgi:uncharacterized membrane protein